MADTQAQLSNNFAIQPTRTFDEHDAPTSRGKGIVRHLCANIKADLFLEIELLFLTFTTGIADALTFPDYHCFASNQTGNTVLLAVSITGLGIYDLFIPENVGLSLACFVAGGWSIGQLGHFIGPRRRLWVLGSNVVQTALVFVAAGLQHWHGVQLQGAYALGVIALLSFASGSQVVLSRAFACTEISTAMATAAWVDLLVDPHILKRHNRGRNRRVAFLISLFMGTLVGAYMYTRVSSAFALLMSAVGKVIVTVMLLFNKSDEKEMREKQSRGDTEMMMGSGAR
ncbi:hypothetical protein MBLNU230_g5581t1 [Neophaeotheca triangularis]